MICEVFRPVATFNSQPHYIVTTPDNQDVLEGLNMALEKIADCNPNLAEKYYRQTFLTAVQPVYISMMRREPILSRRKRSPSR